MSNCKKHIENIKSLDKTKFEEYIKEIPEECQKDVKEYIKEFRKNQNDTSSKNKSEGIFDSSEGNISAKKILQIKENIENKEELKKIFEAVAELKIEVQKKIFEAFKIEEQKKIFEVVADLEVEKQKKIFEAVAELDEKYLLSLHINFLIGSYQCFIQKDQIDSNFFKNNFEKFVIAITKRSETDKEYVEKLQLLKESCYRLIIKVQKGE